MSLALASRRASLLAPWNKNALWRRARSVPSLDLRFADNKSLVDSVTGQQLVTHTRAGGAAYTDSQGVVRTATTNEPRFDHNPATGESLGLLVEEQRTNSIRNNTMVGAVAGTPGTLPTNWSLSGGGIGTLTQQIAGVGTSNGISYIDIRCSGTSSNTGVRIFTEVPGSTAAASGQTWASSVYVAILPGSVGLTSATNDVLERSSIGAIIQTTTGSAYSTIGNSLTRLTTTRTLTDAATTSTQQAITLNWPNTSAIDFTLRIGMPQLEQGAFATSVIPTSGTTVTRAADVVSITGTNFNSWYRQDQGTFLVETIGAPIPGGGYPLILSAEGAANTDRIRVSRYSDGRGRFPILTGNVVQAAFDVLPAWSQGEVGRAAVAFRADDIAGCANGGTVVTDNSATLPQLTQLAIGSSVSSADYYNGCIRRLTFWPVSLKSVLQAITQ